MKGKISFVNSYRYVDKQTGLLKEGLSFTAQSSEKVVKNDGAGNLKIGFPTEEFRLYPPYIKSADELVALIGCDVDIVRDKQIGEKFESVVAITPLDDI